jgi:hypothetical protein
MAAVFDLDLETEEGSEGEGDPDFSSAVSAPPSATAPRNPTCHPPKPDRGFAYPEWAPTPANTDPAQIWPLLNSDPHSAHPQPLVLILPFLPSASPLQPLPITCHLPLVPLLPGQAIQLGMGGGILLSSYPCVSYRTCVPLLS